MVAEFLDPSLETLPCKKFSSVSYENHSFFLLFQNVTTLIKSHYFSLLPFTIWWSTLSSLLDGWYHYIAFMVPVNGYSQTKLHVKEQVSLKSKIRFDYVYLFSPPIDVQLKWHLLSSLFLKKNSLLFDRQYGFRNKLSTNHVLIHIRPQLVEMLLIAIHLHWK